MPRLIIYTATFIFIVLFLYTAIHKLATLNGFAYTLSKSPLLKSIAKPVAIAIPITEMIITTLLFFPRTRTIGLLASAILMSMFTAYIGYMLATASKLPCNCGGIIDTLSWQQHLLVNFALTLLALAAYNLDRHKVVIAIHNRTSRKPVTE